MAKPKQGQRKPLELGWASAEYLAVPVVKKGRTTLRFNKYWVGKRPPCPAISTGPAKLSQKLSFAGHGYLHPFS